MKVSVITLDLSSNSNPVSSKVLKSVVFDALGDILNKKLPIMVAVSYELAWKYMPAVEPKTSSQFAQHWRQTPFQKPIHKWSLIQQKEENIGIAFEKLFFLKVK